MKTDNDTLLARLCQEAYDQGHQRGTTDRHYGYHNSAPLSGEWAGESPNEILGHLFAQCEDMPDEYECRDEIMTCYEQGYQDGNSD